MSFIKASEAKKRSSEHIPYLINQAIENAILSGLTEVIVPEALVRSYVKKLKLAGYEIEDLLTSVIIRW